MHRIGLYWLPKTSLFELPQTEDAGANPAELWPALCGVANTRLDALATMRLDRRRAKLMPQAPAKLSTKPVRLAVLASSTVDHLLPALRVGGMRRGLWVDIYTPHYGQYAQDLMDPSSGLHQFRPTTVLFAMDSHHLVQGIPEGGDVAAWAAQVVDRLASQWATAKQAFGCQVIQHAPLPIFLSLLGENEHRLPWSRSAALRHLTARLRDRADADGVDILSLDDWATRDGIEAWYDPALWHRAKQEIHPNAGPLYGDLVGRLLAAAQGRSFKCLVLDLDNTLWGGVIGDDGLAGIKLGQGSAAGEAHVAFQHYARDLGRRGIILAVCSKNDEANALEPFAKHPEMVLKRDNIACFIANWTDKANNLRSISHRLNIGIDSLVFADDNPAERAIVRRELPMVAVPELPEDPTLYGACIADGGYFEALRVTAEDLTRADQYQDNIKRETLAASSTDLPSYLRSLQMRAIWNRFDAVSHSRVHQLVNKTNQFNLTTRRVSAEDVTAIMHDPLALSLHVRLLDQFGDNGIVAIVAGQLDGDAVRLDLWLMSCRVLGRGLEEETLNLVAAEALRLGARRLVGVYVPSAKNGMVREHYAKLGFTQVGEADGRTEWELALEGWAPRLTFIESVQMAGELQPA